MSSRYSPASRTSPPAARGSSRCSRRAAPASAGPAPAGRRTPASRFSSSVISRRASGSGLSAATSMAAGSSSIEALASLAHDIDRPVAGNRRHPRDRRRQAGIELPGAVPDLDVGLLNDLLREILSPQDTQHHAEEFRARGGVEALESGLIPLRNRGNQPDQLSRRQHSASPKSQIARSLSSHRSGSPDMSYHTLRQIVATKSR